MNVRIKICGLTSPDVVQRVIRMDVDAIGLVFSPSPRQVSPETARELVRSLPPGITSVAVFRTPDPTIVADVVEHVGPGVVQTEVTDDIVRAVDGRAIILPVVHDHDNIVEEVTDQWGPTASTVLLEGDGQGGRGVQPDWTRAAQLARRVPLILAGGLNPGNVADAIDAVRPHGIDVSSGVEREPGQKDPDLVRAFVSAARNGARA